jgi:hypothetical protein
MNRGAVTSAQQVALRALVSSGSFTMQTAAPPRCAAAAAAARWDQATVRGGGSGASESSGMSMSQMSAALRSAVLNSLGARGSAQRAGHDLLSAQR